MEKILNLQRGWKSRLWFGEKAFALCFVIYGTMYVYDLNKSKNDEGGDVDEKRESD